MESHHAQLADNLARVRERVAAAAESVGRRPDEVELVAGGNVALEAEMAVERLEVLLDRPDRRSDLQRPALRRGPVLRGHRPGRHPPRADRAAAVARRAP